MQTVLLQLERLRRHYTTAVRTYDHVSLLDLSHNEVFHYHIYPAITHPWRALYDSNSQVVRIT